MLPRFLTFATRMMPKDFLPDCSPCILPRIRDQLSSSSFLFRAQVSFRCRD